MKKEIAVKFDLLLDQSLVQDSHCEQVGLSLEEFERVKRLLGRKPNKVELGIIGALWSEHCSYKSTKAHLSKLPSTGPNVVVGPGENAGALDIGDGLAVVFKIESHNHPSFIEPFQGAATGVGGILRDIFTMGARPFAALNLLRFGEKTNSKVPFLLDGVVRGISFYGNCFGVPTVLTNIDFHESYNGNNLVNAFAIGVVKKDAIFLSSASGSKNRILYVGAKTGRDGIQGAVMASDSFGKNDEHKRPTVQVGDPFKEKLLLEACLMCFDERLVVGIQDMGAAGLTSSCFEMANKASTGLNINLDHIPLRDHKMTAYEIMLSESQERMIMVVEPQKVPRIKEIFTRFELDCSDIGEVSGDGDVKVSYQNQKVVNLNATLIIENAPRYRRSYSSIIPKNSGSTLHSRMNMSIDSIMKQYEEDLAQKDLGFITDQFDHDIGLNTIIGPNDADAVLLRVPGSNKAVAISLLAHGKLLKVDPFEGARRSVFLSALEVSAQGATAIGISNCLNFGSPKNPVVMTELKHAIDGMANAAVSLAVPIISGNVSLYNETLAKPILPTLAITLVGLNNKPFMNSAFFRAKAGHDLVILGKMPSDYAGCEAIFAKIPSEHTLEAWDQKHVALLSKVLCQIVEDGLSSCVAVINRGGLLNSSIKIMAKSNLGLTLNFGAEWLADEVKIGLISEDTPRVLLSVSQVNLEKLSEICAQKIAIHKIGKIGGDEFCIMHQEKKIYSCTKESLNKIYNYGLQDYVYANQ